MLTLSNVVHKSCVVWWIDDPDLFKESLMCAHQRSLVSASDRLQLPDLRSLVGAASGGTVTQLQGLNSITSACQSLAAGSRTWYVPSPCGQCCWVCFCMSESSFLSSSTEVSVDIQEIQTNEMLENHCHSGYRSNKWVLHSLLVIIQDRIIGKNSHTDAKSNL